MFPLISPSKPHSQSELLLGKVYNVKIEKKEVLEVEV